MKIFGYGSLLCEESLRSTVGDFERLKVVSLPGYRRVFNLKSSGRINKDTGLHSCVLNLEEDSSSSVMGVLYEIPENIVESLHLREEGYGMRKVTFSDNTEGYAYIAKVEEVYRYLFDDATQNEYLKICLEASKKIGSEMYTNFLETTYISGSTLLELRDKLHI